MKKKFKLIVLSLLIVNIFIIQSCGYNKDENKQEKSLYWEFHNEYGLFDLNKMKIDTAYFEYAIYNEKENKIESVNMLNSDTIYLKYAVYIWEKNSIEYVKKEEGIKNQKLILMLYRNSYMVCFKPKNIGEEFKSSMGIDTSNYEYVTYGTGNKVNIFNLVTLDQVLYSNPENYHNVVDLGDPYTLMVQDNDVYKIKIQKNY